MLGLGFGFVEVGTLTPRPQAGNPKPRLFRLAEDRAVINRMGFNNRGQAAAAARLARRGRGAGSSASISAPTRTARTGSPTMPPGVAAMAPLADYLTVNISSPNTPGLRALQDKGALDELLAAVMEARGRGRAAGVPQGRARPRARRISTTSPRVAIERSGSTR